MRVNDVVAILAVALALAASGCKEEPDAGCDLDADIVPGCGVRVGEEEVRLLDERGEVLTRIGDPDTALSFSDAGLFDAFEGSGLTLHYRDEAPFLVHGIIALEGFSGTTVEGVGIGSERATVEAVCGTPAVDPFLGSAWYLDRGIGFEFDGDTVSRIHVVSGHRGVGE